MRLWCLVLAASAWFCESAFAQATDLTLATSGYLYLNRPGANMAEHDSELASCIDVSSHRNEVSDEARSRATTQNGIVGQWVLESMVAGYDRARRSITIEHCMLVRGWRLVRLPEQEGRRLERLSPEELATTLQEWVGSPSPPGEIVRTWRNEGAAPSSVVSSPRSVRRTLLSERALRNPVADRPANAFEATNILFPPRRNIVRARLSDLAPPREGQVLLVAGIHGTRASRSFALFLARFAESGVVDQAIFDMRSARRFGEGRLEDTLVFVVEPGEWRVEGRGSGLGYCMGAPSFRARSGDVIFLGAFDYGAARVAPDLSQEAMQHYLTPTPTIASLARAAEWVNGTTWPCPPMVNYAMEFAGIPYREDYAWASVLAHPAQ